MFKQQKYSKIINIISVCVFSLILFSTNVLCMVKDESTIEYTLERDTIKCSDGTKYYIDIGWLQQTRVLDKDGIEVGEIYEKEGKYILKIKVNGSFKFYKI